MQVVEETRRLQERADQVRVAGRRIALVPTMGALHAGHLALVDAARAKADEVWVTIFVNPTQFGPNEDLERYPRPREADLALCRQRGVDLVFAPSEPGFYAPGHQTWVQVSDLTQPLCGQGRPGHFRGVTTVVTKLFLAAKPHVAVFGEKDFQQLAVLRRMTRDLNFDVEVVGAPIVREDDGVALSSRNRHLAPEARSQARVLVGSLDVAERAVREGVSRGSEILARVRAELARAPLACVEYAELRDPDSLETCPEALSGPALLALSADFPSAEGGEGARVRLIDNRVLYPHPHRQEPPR
jgi:pantoate--beta-alanine ligase